MEYFSIMRYEELQSHNQLNPPWIKLHSHQLEDYMFQKLSDAAKYHFIGLMSLASRIGNKLPNDPQWLQKSIGASNSINLEDLFKSGLIKQVKESK